jgi:hypothetical protein
VLPVDEEVRPRHDGSIKILLIVLGSFLAVGLLLAFETAGGGGWSLMGVTDIPHHAACSC